MCVFPFELLRCHVHNDLAEIMTIEHADKGFGRLLQTVDDILAVADTAVGDAGSDLVQECRIMLCSKFVVDEAAQACRSDEGRNTP